MSVERAAWRAIGTSVEVLVDGGDLAAARQAVEAVVEAADRTYSRFRADSELSRVCLGAAADATVSPLLARAIDAALRAAALTNGLVDPTVGRALRLAGYDVDFALVPPTGEPIRLRVESVPGWRAVSWDRARRRLRIPRGVELDLGSTGKALVCDLAADAAAAAAGRHAAVLVSIGGDIALGGDPPAGGWRIRMAEDSTTPPNAAGEVIALGDGALATSSTTVRRWARGDVRLNHLIDPRTGVPVAGPWRTASVVAASCVDANVAATAAVVLGFGAEGWLGSTGLPARLVATDGSIVRLNDWPRPLPGGDLAGDGGQLAGAMA
jgi:FAD:protein FMN transferase